MNAKYDITGISKVNEFGVEVRRIRASRTFCTINEVVIEGTYGGWVQYYDNLDRYDKSWLSGESEIFGDAIVNRNSIVSGDVKVCENTIIQNSKIEGKFVICGRTTIRDVYFRNNTNTISVLKDASIIGQRR